MFLPAGLVFLLAVGGAVAFVLGARRTGFALLMPAIWRWLLAPALAPYFGGLSWPTLALLCLLALFAAPFAAILSLQKFLAIFYGEHTASKVSGTFLVRLIDAFGRAFMAVAALPFQLIGRAIWRR